MPSRSIRDQMQMRPAPTPGIRPTSPQPNQALVRPTAAPVRAPANVGTAAAPRPQVIAGPTPNMATVSQGMNQVNQQAMQPRVAVPVQQAPVGVAPAPAPRPILRPTTR